MKLYKTIEKEACEETIIEKSRFIAYAKPVETKDEADAFIKEIKKKHRDATHNVPIMVLGNKFQVQWASDDGEPQGTAGAPVLNMLIMEGITNIVIVVTRYFGGIKLGTGGLVRAYTNSAREAVVKGIICDVKELEGLKCTIPYNCLETIKNEEKTGSLLIKGILYEADVTLDLMTERGEGEKLKELILNLTAGKCSFVEEYKRIVKVPVSQDN